mgnify:CR=1 FL=1
MAWFTNDFNAYFKDLAKNNNKEWFDANRKRYETSVKKPFEAFVAEVIQSQALPVALAGSREQSQVLRAAGGEKSPLQRRQQGLGEAGLHEAGGDQHEGSSVDGRESVTAFHRVVFRVTPPILEGIPPGPRGSYATTAAGPPGG